MIGETSTGKVFLFELGELGDIITPDRIEAIHDILHDTFKHHMIFAHLAGMSGAMRWPQSMRPEVMINSQTRVI